MTIAIDGQETWLIHNALYRGEPEFESVDRDWAIRAILGVGLDFRYEVISKEDWVGRRLVANRFRERRVFICGDAAHLWIPNAGYGMNAGIADATNLSWMIAAALRAGRRRNSRRLRGGAPTYYRAGVALHHGYRAKDHAAAARDTRRNRVAGPVGEAIRARIGKDAYDIDFQQQCAGGLNFGYFYGGSPIIAYDGEPHPTYTMHDFTSSTVPGCRAPHLWLGDGRSLYDALGPDYTLIRHRSDRPRRVASSNAAAKRGVPLAVLDVDAPDARALYARKLVLVRPDQHVAWRGDEEPAAPMGVIDLVRGGRTVPASKVA